MKPFKFSILFTLLLTAQSVFSQAYTLLEPGVVGKGKGYKITTSFLEYINLFYKTLLWLTIALAILYIIIGGLQYMTAAAAGAKGDGKAKITNALKGLFIALISYLVLYSINPDLVNWNFKVCQLPISSSNSDPNCRQ